MVVKVTIEILGIHHIGKDGKDGTKGGTCNEVVSNLIVRVLVLEDTHHEVRNTDTDHLDASGDAVCSTHSLISHNHADRGPEAASDHTVAHTRNDKGGDLVVTAEDEVAVEGDYDKDANGEEDHALANVVDQAAKEGDAGDGDEVDDARVHAVLVVEGVVRAAVKGIPIGAIALLEVVYDNGHEGKDADVVERADNAEDPVDGRERNDVFPFDLLGLTDGYKISK